MKAVCSAPLAAFLLVIACPAVSSRAQDSQGSGVDTLPTAKAVFAKCVEAMGGRDRLSKIETVVMKGKADIPEFGASGAVVVYYSKGKLSAVAEFNGAKTLQGVDGAKGWELNPMTGARILSEAEASQLVSSVTMKTYLNPEAAYKTIEVKGFEDVDGEKCVKVDMVRSADDAKESIFFAVDTGLPMLEKSVRKTNLGEVDVVTRIKGYDVYDGIKVPTEMSSQLEKLGMTYNVKTESMKFNGKVDDSVFDVPDAVKDMLK